MSKLDRQDAEPGILIPAGSARPPSSIVRPAFALALLALGACAAPAGGAKSPPEPPSGATKVVSELYDLVTFGPGTTPDWDAVRALFIEEAVIVLRTGRDRMSVFSVDEFVEDFETFIETSDVERTGFTERILDLRETRYGDMATVLVRFESEIPGSERGAHPGLDSFELIRQTGRWQIVSVVNERLRADAGELAGLPSAVGD